MCACVFLYIALTDYVLVWCLLIIPPDDDSLITGPVSLKSYTTVADFMDKKTKFSFKEGTTVQVIQKDPGGEQ